MPSRDEELLAGDVGAPPVDLITVHTVLEAHGLTGLDTTEAKDALVCLAQDGKLEPYEIHVLEEGGYLT